MIRVHFYSIAMVGRRFRNVKCAKASPVFLQERRMLIVTKEFLEKRYKPGRRENSFYMDMPGSAKSKEYAIYSRDFAGYSYHKDKSTGSIVPDELK